MTGVAPDLEFRRGLVEGRSIDVDRAGESGVQAGDEPVGEAVVDKESQSGAGVSILVQSSLAKVWHFWRFSGVRSGKSWMTSAGVMPEARYSRTS